MIGRCDGECAVTCTSDGRKYDDLAGVGGVRATCVDDNFMCLATDPYYNTFSVLVHEWAHTVHQYGLDLYWYNAVSVSLHPSVLMQRCKCKPPSICTGTTLQVSASILLY